jgi:hypothetical protein
MIGARQARATDSKARTDGLRCLTARTPDIGGVEEAETQNEARAESNKTSPSGINQEHANRRTPYEPREFLDATPEKISGKSNFAAAIRYAIRYATSHWTELRSGILPVQQLIIAGVASFFRRLCFHAATIRS